MPSSDTEQDVTVDTIPVGKCFSDRAAETSTIDGNATWIVQKYGGTSVGKQLGTIAQQIAPSYLSQPNVRLAIICSARSGQTKALGTTNLLLQAAREALQPDDDLDYPSSAEANSMSNSMTSIKNCGQNETSSSPSPFSRLVRSSSRGTGLTSNQRRTDSPLPSVLDAKLKGLSMTEEDNSNPSSSVGHNATVDKILEDHIAAVRQAVTKNHRAREELEAQIIEDCERLRDFLMAAKIIEEISPRSKDVIMSIGERLSCRIVVGALIDAGIDAELVGMESVIDTAFLEELQNGRVRQEGLTAARDDEYLDQAFYDLLSLKMAERLRSVRGVPVVTGKFQIDRVCLDF